MGKSDKVVAAAPKAVAAPAKKEDKKAPKVVAKPVSAASAEFESLFFFWSYFLLDSYYCFWSCTRGHMDFFLFTIPTPMCHYWQ